MRWLYEDSGFLCEAKTNTDRSLETIDSAACELAMVIDKCGWQPLSLIAGVLRCLSEWHDPDSWSDKACAVLIKAVREAESIIDQEIDLRYHQPSHTETPAGPAADSGSDMLSDRPQGDGSPTSRVDEGPQG